MLDQVVVAYKGRRIVACSGGADSLCLAHLCLSDCADRTILAHVDHGLRPESGREALRVQELAQQFGAECRLLRVTVDGGASLERAARDARYRALEELALELKADYVLLGHTASDQAETVLLRILRGTGLVGLSAIPKERTPFARPLLHLWREETEGYCRAHGLAYLEDPMNRDPRFARSRVRNHWLPELRKEHPKIDKLLVGLARQARSHRDVLDYAAASILEERRDDARLRVDQGWKSIPEDLAIRVIQLFWEECSGAGGGELAMRHLESMYRLSCAPVAGTKSMDLPGAQLLREYDQLRIDLGLDLGVDHEILGVPDGCLVRTWRPGDRIRPLRLRGKSKKLSDLFGEAKIPLAVRAEARVVERCSDGELLWAEHIGSAFATGLSIRRVPKAQESAT